ncbi:MAG: MaoC/PaaZ C-terminal domain-containing protein [Polyangiaceae bacterium]
MPINLDAVGAVSGAHELRYGWRELALYALGIGARRDLELPYLYEGCSGGIKAFPTFCVIPAFDAVRELMQLAGIQMKQVIHSEQAVTVEAPLPPEGVLSTTATLDGVYDLKRFATAKLSTETRLGGKILVRTVWSIVVTGEGRFGGPRPPRDAETIAPPKDRAPDFERAWTTTEEQALLYRLSGDINPLHADPAVAAEAGFDQGPILHGLSTFGHVARTVVLERAGGDADRLVAIAGRFSKPVWPGDTIVVSGWDMGEGRVALQARVTDRPEPVMTHMWARVAAS